MNKNIYKKNIYKKGFTLIELSAVLTVVALLAGGILVGQSMFRQSQIMSAITDEQRYVKAALAFRDKYASLPGDMGNAQSYWGTSSSCTTSSTQAQTATCNGNGDGLINSNSCPGATAKPYENFYAWQHLADAGFIQGSYTGAQGTNAANDNEPGLNVPAARLTNAGFEWIGTDNSATVVEPGAGNASYAMNSHFPMSTYQQYLLFGGRSGYDLLAPALSGSEASGIDAKIDDGLPGSGSVVSTNASTALPGYTANCVTASSTYATTSTLACVLLFQVKW